jgi:hypothetical protein
MSTLIFVAVLYFAVNIGQVYWRYYQFRDDMRQYVRFHDHYSDKQIAAGLAASADSLGLPQEAADVRIQRASNSIALRSDYDEIVELPMTVREFHFHVRADSTW